MHIVYICSPDKKLELYSSLHSLFVSGTVFDRLTLLIVSNTHLKWQQFKDKRIKIEQVADIGAEFWMMNKTHLCNIQDDDILFIDTDTIILKPLNMLGSNAIGDIVGRTTSYYEHPKWPERAWREYLSRFGAAGFFPYLNSGLLLFRNGAHRQLAEPWKKITRALLVDPNFPFGALSHANQLAFSLAAGSLGVSYGLLTSTEHAYGWKNEPFQNAVVYHTGGPKFEYYAIKISRETNIFNKRPSEVYHYLRWNYFAKRIKQGLLRYKTRGMRLAKSISGLK